MLVCDKAQIYNETYCGDNLLESVIVVSCAFGVFSLRGGRNVRVVGVPRLEIRSGVVSSAATAAGSSKRLSGSIAIIAHVNISFEHKFMCSSTE